jgi:IclR helix-turn-helix domain
MKQDSKAPAIARAAAILRLLGKSDVPLGVNAIARELELAPSTCLYVLRAPGSSPSPAAGCAATASPISPSRCSTASPANTG